MTYSAPAGRELSGIMISTYSRESVGGDISGALGWNTPTSAAVATANKAFYVPLYLHVPVVAVKLWWANGASVAGNVDCGIYRYSDLSRVVSTGSTAQSGTNTVQSVDIADTELGRGVYYLALSASSTSATFIMNSSGTLQQWKSVGIVEEASALPLPATATPTAFSSTGNLVLCGLSLRTLV